MQRIQSQSNKTAQLSEYIADKVLLKGKFLNLLSIGGEQMFTYYQLNCSKTDLLTDLQMVREKN